MLGRFLFYLRITAIKPSVQNCELLKQLIETVRKKGSILNMFSLSYRHLLVIERSAFLFGFHNPWSSGAGGLQTCRITEQAERDLRFLVMMSVLEAACLLQPV